MKVLREGDIWEFKSSKINDRKRFSHYSFGNASYKILLRDINKRL